MTTKEDLQRAETDNQIKYILGFRYKNMFYKAKKEGIPIDPRWLDYNNFVNDVLGDFIKLYDLKPKRIFLKRIIPEKGFYQGNIIWMNTNIQVNHKRIYNLNGNFVSLKELCQHFGWNVSYRYYINKHSIEEVNTIINSDSPNDLIKKKSRPYKSQILYQGKIYSISGIARLFNSKGVKFTKQALSLKFIKKRKLLDLSPFDPVPMDTKEILEGRGSHYKLTKSQATKIIDKFNQELQKNASI